MVCRFLSPFLLALIFSFLAACSSGKAASAFGNGTRDPNAPGGDAGDSFGGNGSGLPTGPGGDCSEAAKLVYVVSEEKDLYSFRPGSLAFTRIGAIQCPGTASATPNSMAVDRSGFAWVNYSDGSLFRVSTADASCTSTAFTPGQHGFVKFGMAFSSNSPGSSDETLYVCGIVDGVVVGGGENGLGTATIDLSSMKLQPIGDFTGALKGQGAELTGTGDARLFGFVTTKPATVAEIAKSTAATPTPQSLPGVSTGTAWAFSFWGGDFWFYTNDAVSSPGSTSNVTRLKTATDKSLSVVKQDIGFRIVGAGVSTCAPTVPAK